MRPVRACLMFLSLCLPFTQTAPCSAHLLDSPWPEFRHDSSHTGRSALHGPETALLRWTHAFADTGQSSPAVGNDVIYVVGGGSLVAVSISGQALWSYPLGSAGKSSPAVVDDGTVYVASTDSHLYAVTTDGRLKWKKSLQGPTDASPTVGPDGTVYIGCASGSFQAYASSGMLRFSYLAQGAVASSAALADDGTVYFGCDDGNLYALRPDGTLKWKFLTSQAGAIQGSPAVGPDGTVYFGSMSGHLYAVWPTGVQRWRFAAGGAIFSSPAIASDGTICVGCRDKYIYAVSGIGSLKWKYRTNGCVDSSPAIDSNGALYVGSNDGSIYSLDRDGALRWALNIGEGVISSPALGTDACLYVAAYDGALCCIAPAQPPPAPIVTDDGVYSTSPTTLHASWTCDDPAADIVRYEYAIGTSPGAEDLVPFTDAGLATQVTLTDLPLVNGADYYFAVRAVDSGGILGDVGVSDGIRVDFTPPAEPVVIDDGDYTTSSDTLHVVYSSGDTESGIDRYEYCVGAAPDLADLLDWQNAGLVKEQTITGLSLAGGVTYFVNVRAFNHAGLMSQGHSNGITVDFTPPALFGVEVYISSEQMQVVLDASDPESGIAGCRYVLLTSPDLPPSPAWVTPPSCNQIIIPGPFDGGQVYYVAAQVTNGAGQSSAVVLSDAAVVDETPPTTPTVTDDGDFTATSDSLHAAYTSSDPQSGVVECSYCIGTSPGSDDVFPWTSQPADGSITASGLALESGVRYYFSVKVRNGAGLWSAVGTSDGIEYRPGVSVWPKFRCDAANTGRSGIIASVTGEVRWTVQTQGYVESSAAIAGDGTAYLGSSDGKLYAISSSGSIRWAYQTGSCIDSSPAIGPGGEVYIGSYDFGLYCLHPNGTLKWRFEAGGMIWSSPNVDPHGVVYFGCHDGYLYALDPDGTLKWKYYAGAPIWSSPALGTDCSIYFGCGNGKLYALTSEGVHKWHYQTGSSTDSSPALAQDVVYCGSGDGGLYAVNADGTLRWRAAVGSVVDSSAAVGPDGTIYVGSGGAGASGALHAFSPLGAEMWRLSLPGGVTSSPAVSGDGTIYVGCADGKLYAAAPDGSVMWSHAAGQSICASPSIRADGAVIAGSDDGVVYCFKDPGGDDTTPPTVPSVHVQRNAMTPDVPLSAWWSASDPESGIDSYSYAVGTQPASDDVVAWTNVGLTTSVIRDDLPLVIGETYYVSVTATNGASLVSEVGVSTPVVILPDDPAATIGAAKKLPVGTQVQLPGKIVSAVFEDCVFIQELDRSAGVRCVVQASQIPAGSILDVQGEVATANGETVLTDVSIEQSSSVLQLSPVAVSTRVVSAVGVDVKGLLVRVAGRVVQTGTDYFILSDGAWLTSPRWAFGVEVRVQPEDVPPVGTCVAVTGIPCREVVNGYPVTIIRAVADPQIVTFSPAP